MHRTAGAFTKFRWSCLSHGLQITELYYILARVTLIWLGVRLVKAVCEYHVLYHHYDHSIFNIKVNLNTLKDFILKLNTMQLKTPGGNHCCLMANDVPNSRLVHTFINIKNCI